MAHRFAHQPYALSFHSQWPEEFKQAFVDGEGSNAAGDRPFDAGAPSNMAYSTDSRRQSVVKIEDDSLTTPLWTDRPHPHVAQMRHYSHPNVPTISTNSQQMGRMHDQGYGPSFGPSPTWPLSAHSQSSTPTPLYAPVQDPMPVQFDSTEGTFPYQHEPPSATAMSPQSSQGGWASTTSSDSAEHRHGPGSPQFRAVSPMTVVRSDGIRKKNARFEIPKERNLHNIDMLIAQSTDEQEKKELKQQKRLLRNRQAALDSRQRKKNHTDQLEKEKKHLNGQKQDLEDTIIRLENALAQEREEWMQERQQYQAYIHTLQYERDEAIRTKTNETADLRRQNNVLKDCVRDFERQQATRGFSSVSNSSSNDAFPSDFSSFGNLDLEDNWDEFSLINHDDLKMEGEDTPQRQLTPRPPPAPQYTTAAASASISKNDQGFSWNTFYMCLLFGAFIASQSPSSSGAKETATDNANPSSSVTLPNALPSLSEDYRNEAGNVLKAVLSSSGEVNAELLHPSLPHPHHSATISDAEFSLLSNQHHTASNLDSLHAHLTTPSRQQETAAAFSLSADSYNHITNPDGMLDQPSPTTGGIDAPADGDEPKPTRLQQLFATMQAERDGVERVTGLGGKARERSVLLDRVPEKVLRDFRALVEASEAQKRAEH